MSDTLHFDGLDLKRVEEVGLNGLQTQRQLFYDGWLLRISPGKAKRARSVNPCFGSTLAARAQDSLLRANLRRARLAGAVPHHAVHGAPGPGGGTRALAATRLSSPRWCS